MSLLITSAALAAFIAVPAFAQNPAPAGQNNPAAATTTNRDAPANPAIKTTEGNNPGAPAPGANSYTEGQAKSHIESRGYANVSGLEKDANGFWRGKAQKDGRMVNVTLDYQGNVVAN